MRAKLKELDILRVALLNEYTCCLHKATRVQLPDGTSAVSITVGFVDAEGTRRITAHTYIGDDGTIKSRGGKLDPKFFLDDANVAYKVEQR